MMQRAWCALIAGCLALAAGLAAASIEIEGKVPAGGYDWYAFEVEFSTLGSEQLALELATASATGLDVILMDCDSIAGDEELIAFNLGAETDATSGAGSISLVLATESYLGPQRFMLRVGTDSSGGSSIYAGTLSTLSSSITLIDTTFIVRTRQDLQRFGNYAFREYTLKAGAPDLQTVTEYRIDFGAIETELAHHVEFIGGGLSSIRIDDITDPVIPLMLFSEDLNPAGQEQGGAVISATHQGKARFRITTVGNSITDEPVILQIMADGAHPILSSRTKTDQVDDAGALAFVGCAVGERGGIGGLLVFLVLLCFVTATRLQK